MTFSSRQSLGLGVQTSSTTVLVIYGLKVNPSVSFKVTKRSVFLFARMSNDIRDDEDDGYWWYSPVSTVSCLREQGPIIHSIAGSLGDQMGHHRRYLLDSDSLVCRRILPRSKEDEERLASTCIS